MEQSPMLELAPILMVCTSPRTLAPYQTELPGPSDTSPITEAVGATKAAAAVFGTAPCGQRGNKTTQAGKRAKPNETSAIRHLL
jgi:hypothetical protein